jgi:hypothetical protein
MSTRPLHDVLVWRPVHVGAAFRHSTLCPDQQQPPFPQLLVATCTSPGKHWPEQNGAVPRQVSACAAVAVRAMNATTAAINNQLFIFITLRIMCLSFEIVWNEAH